MQINQRGEPIKEEYVSIMQLDDSELRSVFSDVLDHLRLHVIRTNMTKHGDTVLEVRPVHA